MYVQVGAVDPWWEGAVLNLPGYPERIEVTRGVADHVVPEYREFREKKKETWAKAGYGCI